MARRWARSAVAVAKISGVVGTYSPSTRRWAIIAAALGLAPADVATQVVLRDGIAEWGGRAGHHGDRLRGDRNKVRHGQRTEVWERPEAFHAVPEGLQRDAAQEEPDPVRADRRPGPGGPGYVTPVTEGIPLWHERDISHLVERAALPDAAIATDYLLRLTRRLVDGLVADADRMRANLESTGGLVFTSAVLLDLVRSGLSRGRVRAGPGRAAMETWRAARRSGRRCARTRTRPASADEAGLGRGDAPERYVARSAPFDRLAARSDRWAGSRQTAPAPGSSTSPLAGPAMCTRRATACCWWWRATGSPRTTWCCRPRSRTRAGCSPRCRFGGSSGWIDLGPHHHLVSADLPADPAIPAIGGRAAGWLEMLPVECAGPRLPAGPAWRPTAPPGQSAGRAVVRLVDGSRLPEPVFTPTTKVPVGTHDEAMTYAQVVDLVGADRAAELRDRTLAVYRRSVGRPRSGGSCSRTPTRVRPGRGRRADLRRRGTHPGLVPVVAGGPVGAGRPQLVVRQAVVHRAGRTTSRASRPSSRRRSSSRPAPATSRRTSGSLGGPSPDWLDV